MQLCCKPLSRDHSLRGPKFPPQYDPGGALPRLMYGGTIYTLLHEWVSNYAVMSSTLKPGFSLEGNSHRGMTLEGRCLA